MDGGVFFRSGAAGHEIPQTVELSLEMGTTRADEQVNFELYVLPRG